MSDTAGYSDIVFGLFRLLGHQFSPRLADLGDTRFWRTDPHADYGPLDGIARHRADTTMIATHWEACCGSPAACPPAPYGPVRSSASSKEAGGPLRLAGRSPSSAGS